MAASAAASVVWLTAITLESVFGSALAGAFTALAAFASVFLVTGTFSFSGAVAAARDEGFAFDAAGFAVGFTAGFVALVDTGLLAFVGVLVGVLTPLAGFVAAAFFTTGFAIDLPEATLVAAALVFFAEDVPDCVCFAGFFIAFALESIQPVALVRW